MWKNLALAGLVVVSITFIQACGRKVNPEVACNFVQNGALQRVSWKQNLPVRMYIHDSVRSQEYIDAIEWAAEQWNQVLGRQAIVIEASYVGGALNPKRDGYSMIYLMSDWDDDKPTEQARTTIHWSGDTIYEADVRLNDRNFSFFVGPETDSNGVHLQSLMVHEFGHVLGLAHTSQKSSVMVTTLYNGEIRNRIMKIDQESLACEY